MEGRNWEETHGLSSSSQGHPEAGWGSVYSSISPLFFSDTHSPVSAPHFLVLSGGRPPLKATSSATVFVNLLDLNDNDPTFQNLPFVAEVLEGTPAGVSVYQVSMAHLPCPLWAKGAPCTLHVKHFMRAGDASQDPQRYVSQVAWDSRCPGMQCLR